MKALDLTNQKFGKLLALTPTKIGNIQKRGWKCQCDCGNIIDVLTFQLTSGHRKTCGCKSIDVINKYIGNRYGKLIVKSFNSKDKNRRNLLNCICDCGNEKITSTKNLERGSTNHCGCLTSERKSLKVRKKFGEASRNALILSYKNNAKYKNREFSLSNEEMITLFQSNCYYCGTEPSTEYKKKRCNGNYIYNGIDRLNNNLGYIHNNVVSCCSMCNYIKNKYNYDKFTKWIIRVYDNLKENKKID